MFGGQQPTSGGTTGTPSLFGTTGGATGTGPPSGGFSFGAAPTASGPPSFSFGASVKQGAPAAGGFSLGTATQGNTAISSAATTAGGGFKFGGVTTTGATPSGGLTLGQPAASVAPQAASTITAPTTGFSLGGAASTAPSLAAGGAPSTGFSLLGGATAATGQISQPLATTASTGGLGAGLGFSLGTAATPNTTTAASTGLKLGSLTTSAPGGLTLSTATTSAPGGLGGGFKLGDLGAKPATGGLSLATPASSTTSAPTGLGLLGAKPTTTAATSAPGTGLGLGAKPAAAPTGTSAPTATMSYNDLEKCINKWTVELEEQEKVFLQQAGQVNAWDRTLVSNGEKITSLHNDLEKVKADQQRLEHELDYIVSQQRELEDILVPLEESCKVQEGTQFRQHTDVERERTYQMAENIDSQLKRMVQDLKEIIDHMNASNTPTDNADPITQVAKILNAHMNSLQWIDQNAALVQRKVDEVSRQYEVVKRDQERNVHLAFE
ncbi:uncharacterized protein [Diadema setosum]|uniref:uncharacterized protein n=1 Tax=Diadema setosum TaxID=31175 RepID=UPI003B3B8DAA